MNQDIDTRRDLYMLAGIIVAGDELHPLESSMEMNLLVSWVCTTKDLSKVQLAMIACRLAQHITESK